MIRRRGTAAIAAVLAAAALAAGCGGDDQKPAGADKQSRTGISAHAGGQPAERIRTADTPSEKAADLAQARHAMRIKDFDTAIKLMTALGGYRGARKRVPGLRVVAAREKLAAAKRKLRVAPSPQAAVALAKTSLRYHPTPDARRFLRRAIAAHDRFKRRQRRGLEQR